MADLKALHRVMSKEGETMHASVARELEREGLVLLRGCSDGNYIELTDKGRAALQENPDG
jgi:predicted transcriptional regulator